MRAFWEPDVEPQTEEEEDEPDLGDLLSPSPPRVTGLASLADYASYEGPLDLPHGGLADLHPQEMAALIWEVVSIEGPIHQDLVLLRLRSAAGAARIGAKTQSAFGWGLDFALRRGPLIAQGAFLLLPNQLGRSARSRANRPSSERKAAWVPPQEVEQALERTVANSLGITGEQAAHAAWKMLGFQRTSSEMLQLSRLAIEKLCQTGSLIKTGEVLTIPEAPPRRS